MEQWIRQWRAYALRLADAYVCLLADLNTETQQGKQFKAQGTFPKKSGHPDGYVALVFSVSMCSEAAAQPHIHGAPFNKERFQKLLGGYVNARNQLLETDEHQWVPGDMFVCLDGQKSGERVGDSPFCISFSRSPSLAHRPGNSSP